MPRLTPADASLILDHVVGDPSVPDEAANALLAGLPFPSSPTPRLLRSVLLRRLASDPVSPAALDSLHLLSFSSPAAPVAAAHLAVAAFLAASAPDFDAAARVFFARRRPVDEGGDPAFVSAEAVAVADQFKAAIGNAFSQGVLRGQWGNRAAAEGQVRELLVAEWAAIGPSILEMAAERIGGEGAVETWRAEDEATRAKYRMLVGEERAKEILCELEEPTSHVNPISSPEVQKVMDSLKSSCADLHSVVDDPLPAAKAAANEVLTARMDKTVDTNAETNDGQSENPAIAGSSAPNDKGEGSREGEPPSLMNRNSTAQTLQWEDSPDSKGSAPLLHRSHLPNSRRIPVSPLQAADNKTKRRKARKWLPVEEDTLREGVKKYGFGNWTDILTRNPDVFVGRTPVDLKDKWRNMMK